MPRAPRAVRTTPDIAEAARILHELAPADPRSALGPLIRTMMHRASGFAAGEPDAPLDARFSKAADALNVPASRLCDVYEALLGAIRSEPSAKPVRRARGVYYTPPALVEHVLDAALDPILDAATKTPDPSRAEDALLALRVCDPACGGGRFLLAAATRIARRLARLRGDEDPCRAMKQVVRRCVIGVDIDPIAVDLCRLTLALPAGLDPGELTPSIRKGDALLNAPREHASTRESADAWCASFLSRASTSNQPGAAANHGFFHWNLEFPEVLSRERPGFDVLIGNPPFLNQLSKTTATTRGVSELLAARSGGVLRRYADAAAAFMILALELTREGGRASLVQPQSLLATADAAPVRRALLRGAALRSLWVSNEKVFESAGVYTCAPAFEVGGTRRAPLQLTIGSAFVLHDVIALDNDDLAQRPTWAHLAADASCVPDITLHDTGTLADIARANADFRDQYYGLIGSLVEDSSLTPEQRSSGDYPPLLTSGLIDLAGSRWSEIPTRIHKRVWRAPRLDRAAVMRTDLARWLAARSIPKVLLATQTRVIELYADDRGEFVPCVPVITVTPRDPSRLWHAAAALASPVAAALALRRYAGAALSAGAIKLSARQALSLPVPTNSAEWDRAADLLRRAHYAANERDRATQLLSFGDAACRAAQLGDRAASELMTWWLARLRPSRTPRGSG